MNALLESIAANPGPFIPYFAIGVGVSIGAIALVGGILTDVLKNRDRERTRREIAAYLAEGSISPEDADRLLEEKAPEGRRRRRCG
jgi:hypothetical protein